MRRPRHDGQKPRRLHENATSWRSFLSEVERLRMPDGAAPKLPDITGPSIPSGTAYETATCRVCARVRRGSCSACTLSGVPMRRAVTTARWSDWIEEPEPVFPLVQHRAQAPHAFEADAFPEVSGVFQLCVDKAEASWRRRRPRRIAVRIAGYATIAAALYGTVHIATVARARREIGVWATMGLCTRAGSATTFVERIFSK
jgi:hypothetical protein